MIFAVAAASSNHSCVPSCAVHFGRTASDEVWDGWEAPSLLLLREVAEEEELTIAYVDAEAPLRERTAALAALHGFRCRCERCGVQRGVSRTAKKLREEGAAERSLDELGALGLRALDAGLRRAKRDLAVDERLSVRARRRGDRSPVGDLFRVRFGFKLGFKFGSGSGSGLGLVAQWGALPPTEQP